MATAKISLASEGFSEFSMKIRGMKDKNSTIATSTATVRQVVCQMVRKEFTATS